MGITAEQPCALLWTVWAWRSVSRSPPNLADLRRFRTTVLIPLTKDFESHSVLLEGSVSRLTLVCFSPSPLFFHRLALSGSSACEQGEDKVEGPASLEVVPAIVTVRVGCHLGMVRLLKRTVPTARRGSCHVFWLSVSPPDNKKNEPGRRGVYLRPTGSVQWRGLCDTSWVYSAFSQRAF